jgi:hypothetical protein
MMNKLHLIRKTVRLNCTWVPTGDPKTPLACVWTETRAAQAAPAASSVDEAGHGAGRIHLCA